MRKTFLFCFRVLQLSWQANGFYTILGICSRAYEEGFYPLIQVLLLSRLLDLFATKNLQFHDLTWIVGAYISASLLKIILTTYLDIKQVYVDFKFESHLDYIITKKLSELDPATFEDPKFQSLFSQMEGVKGSMQAHIMKVTNLISQIVKFVTAVIVIVALFPLIPIVILLATIPSYIVLDKYRDATFSYFTEKRSPLLRLANYIKTLMSSDSTSKEATIFKTSPILLKKVRDYQTRYYHVFEKAIDPWLVRVAFTRIVQFTVFLYTQFLTISKMMQGTISIGQFTLFFQQTLALTFGAEEILNQYSSITMRNKYFEKFYEFLATEKRIISPIQPASIPPIPQPPVIVFNNVSFKYPKTERYILSKFNLTINPGDKVALVGENGAGKTTLIKLLLRFYDVTEGEILINGVNIKNISLEEWHMHIGALFQDFIKYQFTFKENVYFGDVSKANNEALLKEAITKSGANKYLETLPNNINQVVGKMFDGGIDLSGGQWQKLALSRAFFRNAPILILDEPTSAIDAKAEYEIFENVQKLQKDKTVIIISHRFSTVRNADRILVLDEGKIIEEGNHGTLMKKKGLYAELFNIQAQGYK